MGFGISGNVSYEGDIDINVSHPFGTASTSYDTETALLHELGHFLGLGHSGTTYSVMSTPQAKGQRKRSLFEDEIKKEKYYYEKIYFKYNQFNVLSHHNAHCNILRK